MKKQAYALLKGAKMIGTFHNSRRAVKKAYPKQVLKEGYSIGVFNFTETIDPAQSTEITLWTDNWGKHVYGRGKGELVAVDENYKYDMSNFHKFTIDEDDVKQDKHDSSLYRMTNFESIVFEKK
ncbi:hypothetical protein PQE70_gp042 [Bacillus phage vB_BanS_Nate]|uniref:Uncharacterized protein n=1 Tax=Bacillus phage vB_BanS_Nate TaxID=2894788 RepID=A0AAE9CDM2_9CAUD|nr:hypothetical protein PQE70_gp042 [Bacillus phage vB_BanS_Nate]UGO50895.1 hypothetical protein NATE_42 [Bacillus phage vB_BanS_Nate]